jgi:hypothetical protein
MKVNKVAIICLVLISLLFSGCRRTLTASEYIPFVSDYQNGLHVKKDYQEYVFDLQYIPLEMLALQRGIDISDDALKAFKDENSGLQYFTLAISLNDKSMSVLNYKISDIAQRQVKEYYFSYLFEKDIKLEEEGKSLPCKLYHFERNAQAANQIKLVLAFENQNQNSEEVRLVISSEEFGSLPIKIKVSKNNIPALKI